MTDIEYRYIAYSLHYNTVISELELRDVKFDSVLSGVGTASGSVYFDRNLGSTTDVRAATEPGSTGLYILRNGEVVWGGIIDKRDRNPESGAVSISCSSFESYYARYYQKYTKYFDATVDDQLSIASWLANQPNVLDSTSTIGIEVPVGQVSGVKRSRTFLSSEYKTILDELTALAGLINGFDFTIVPYINSSGALARKLTFGYPTLGVAQSDTTLVWDYPGNINSVVISEDAKSGATRMYGLGAGDAEYTLVSVITSDKVIAPAYGPALVYPVYEQTRSYKSVYSPTTLAAHAQSDLQRLLVPIRTFQVDVTGNQWPYVNDYSVGDWFALNIQDEFLDNGQLSTYGRIQSYSVSVPDSPSAGESISLVFELPKLIQDDGTTVDDGT